MKQFFNHFLLTVALGCIAGMGIVDTHAQVPTRFNHQAVVRDTLGQLMANRTLSLRISLEQSAGGASVVRYRELHQVTTNANGLFTLEVGGGTVEQGQMDSVNWSAGSVFLRTEVDPAGGQNYVLSSHRELLSVPYALYSLHARNAPVSPQAGQINYWNGTEWVTLPPGNSGSVLSMCNGVPVWGPCPNSPSLATVSTLPVTQLTGFSASTGGNVTSDGGSPVTHKGVAYSDFPNPSISSSYTVDGSGTGSFVSILNNLTVNTTYYLRAYATNAVGTSYGSEKNITISTSLPAISIGQTYGGGIVFFVDSTGQHGLICAPFDQGFSSWGLNGINVIGTSTALGAGANNTNVMVSYGVSAATLCDTLVLNGYSDWYLPSAQEFGLICSNILPYNLGNMAIQEYYWTSSQYDIYNAWYCFIYHPHHYSLNYGNGKNNNYKIRAIRSF